MFKYSNRGISMPIAIGIIAVLVIVIGGGILAYQYYYIPKQEIKNPVVGTPNTETPKNEIANWNSYTYLSAQSGILPDINFKYPSLFGDNPSLISSRNVNRPENITADWGGFVEFNPTGAFGNKGLRIEFFKKSNSEANFEGYVTKSATAGGWGSPKYFQAGNYKVAHLRFASSSHYDADVAWYFIEFPNKTILAISTSGDKKFLYDDDENGNSTRDKIISTFKFSETTKEGIRNIDLSKFAVEAGIAVPGLSQEINTPQYADLDSDGETEAVFTAFSGGTSGSFGPFVVKLRNNVPVQLKIDPDPSISEEIGSNWGHIGFFIVKGRLIKYFPLYKSGDANCCPTAGLRYILYKWENNLSKFVVERAMNLEPEWLNKTYDESSREATRRLGL